MHDPILVHTANTTSRTSLVPTKPSFNNLSRYRLLCGTSVCLPMSRAHAAMTLYACICVHMYTRCVCPAEHLRASVYLPHLIREVRKSPSSQLIPRRSGAPQRLRWVLWTCSHEHVHTQVVAQPFLWCVVACLWYCLWICYV